MYYTELLFYFSCPCKDGWTSLKAAAGNGHVECLRALLSAGADIHVQNKVSIFSIFLTCHLVQTTMVILLILIILI